MTTKLARPAALASLLFAGAASAVNLNPAGVGQVLIYPYYTVNQNQDTLISLSNTEDSGKAVLVTFREGYNGRVVMHFTLFLAAHDRWSAAISLASPDGGAQIASADESCVGDAPLSWPQKFSSVDYAGGVPGYSKDSGPQGIERTREGMIEVIALGDIKPGSATDLAIRPPAAGGKPTCAVPELFSAISRRPAMDWRAAARSSTRPRAPITPTTPMLWPIFPPHRCSIPPARSPVWHRPARPTRSSRAVRSPA